MACLVYVNEKRLSFNSTMYENSTVPAKHPGGGGFCVMKFTLKNLYEMFEYCQNWWTCSNDNLPLCKYLGVTLKCYASENTDYVLRYVTQYPTTSNKLTYPSCQPAMMLLSKQKVIMPSLKTKRRRKPYTKIHIAPPPQFQTKWYFQQDIADKPLLVLHAAPCSLLHMYISTQSESNNVTIQHINTKLIHMRNWGNKQFETQHWWFKYSGTLKMYFYRYSGNLNHNKPEEFKLGDIVPLTQIQRNQEGTTFNELYPHNGSTTEWQQYCNTLLLHAGNIFHKQQITHTEDIFYSTVEPTTAFKATHTKDTPWKNIEEATTRVLTKLQEDIILQTRYNPNIDDGKHTIMYLLKNNEQDQGYEKPNKEEYILEGFPLWLNIFGFIDFQKRLNNLISPETNYILAFKTDKTRPIWNDTFVVIDTSFTGGQSPYETQVSYQDYTHWYPQIQYQTQMINNITKTGPATTKLEGYLSEEIKIEYSFHFKWGGSPAKMVTVDNPATQIVYPIPRSEYETPSLQSPAQGYETVLYTFDQRNLQLTKAAIQRIKQDWETKCPISPITESTREVPTLKTLEALLNETPEEKESEEALLLQLHQHKQQQRLLKQRIMDLLSQTQSLE